MSLVRRILTLLAFTTLTNAADDTSLTPQQHDCGGLRGDGSCAATTTSVCKGVQNFASAAGRVRRTLERGGWAALQKLDASALCASELVAQDEAPCYCGDAADDCFEHADVIRELTKYVDDDDDDDEDDVEEAIAPAPRQAPPAGWGKLLSA